MSEWGVPSVQAVVKVGDTVSDIREGRNADDVLLNIEQLPAWIQAND
ncbi:hypothetical protein [Agathobaculum butyriciproducens]